jgi:hypothetical protein
LNAASIRPCSAEFPDRDRDLGYVSEVRILVGGYGEALLRTGVRPEVSRRRVKLLMAKLEGIS